MMSSDNGSEEGGEDEDGEKSTCPKTFVFLTIGLAIYQRNNECPACRKHRASRCSLRDDQRFDNLTEVLYADIEKYEEEELAFHEEEKTRNKQIQASVAQVLQRQSEALMTRHKTGKNRHSSSRLPRVYSRRRHFRETEHEGSEDNDGENNPDENKDSSSTDKRGAEFEERRCRRRPGGQLSQPSPLTANSEGGGIENDLEATKESKGTSSGPVWNPEMLAWGGAGLVLGKRVSGTTT